MHYSADMDMPPMPKALRDYFAHFGKKGGKIRARKLTPKQREDSARNAAKARWAKTRAGRTGAK